MDFIVNMQNISFGHLLPTKPLLRTCIGVQNFEDSKALCIAIGKKNSGHISYYNRAKNLVKEVEDKNSAVKKFVDMLKNAEMKNKEPLITDIAEKVGEYIDVIL